MAPRPPWNLAALSAHLKQTPPPALPILLGSPHLHNGVGVVHQDGCFRLRRLVLAEKELEAYRLAQMEKKGSFYPEDVDRYQRPTGAILAEGKTLDDFLAALQKIPWESNW